MTAKDAKDLSSMLRHSGQRRPTSGLSMPLMASSFSGSLQPQHPALRSFSEAYTKWRILSRVSSLILSLHPPIETSDAVNIYLGVYGVNQLSWLTDA